MAEGLLAAKHVDDVNMACLDGNIVNHVNRLEALFGECRLDTHTSANCAVRYTMNENCDVNMDQHVCIKQLRPISHPDLVGADPGAKASNAVLHYGLCGVPSTNPRANRPPS